MQTNRKLLCFLLLITWALFSCKKEKEVPITKVPSWLNQLVPYKPGQVVRYANAAGVIITATVEKTTRVSEQAACAGCPVNKRVEYFEYDIKSGSSRLMTLSIDYRPNVFLTIWSPEDGYSIGSGLDFLVKDGQTMFECNGPRQVCLPSVTLNGVTFNDVLETRNTGHPLIVKAYYTISQGVVGFVNPAGQAFHRIP